MKLFKNEPVIYNIKTVGRKDQKLEHINSSIVTEASDYKNIPKSQYSVRFDSGNTNTITQPHAHVFACRNGKGKELYAVNKSGTGHDGSTGQVISPKVANFLRVHGFSIPENLVLESLDVSAVLDDGFVLIIVY